jgi:gas vesicle protein
MKNSSLFIGLGIGLLVGTAIGLFIATGDEEKAELMEGIKAKADDVKKTIGKIVKQGMEELDNAVDHVKQTAQDTISKMGGKSESKVEDIQAESV